MSKGAWSWTWLVPSWLLFGVLACGSSEGDTAGAGGSGSGGSGPPQPRAQAALSLSITAANPPIAGKSCSTTALSRTVGEGPTTTVPGARIVDDENQIADEIEISCTVSGLGTFDVEADILHMSTGFTLSAQITAGSTGSADITVFTPDTLLLASPPGAPCALDVSSENLQVMEGALWASFSCPSVEAGSSTACAARGVVILENCQN